MKCEICIQTARFEDSVPDPNTRGANHLNECGYRRQFLCLVHAMERRQVATSRVKPLVLRCRICKAEGDWDSWGLNPRQGTLQCSTCARRGYDLIPEFVYEVSG